MLLAPLPSSLKPSLIFLSVNDQNCLHRQEVSLGLRPPWVLPGPCVPAVMLSLCRVPCHALHEGCDIKTKLCFLLKIPPSCLLGLQEVKTWSSNQVVMVFSVTWSGSCSGPSAFVARVCSMCWASPWALV